MSILNPRAKSALVAPFDKHARAAYRCFEIRGRLRASTQGQTVFGSDMAIDAQGSMASTTLTAEIMQHSGMRGSAGVQARCFSEEKSGYQKSVWSRNTSKNDELGFLCC
ncbi:MAG: hypothetical protein ACP5QB_09105 [Thiomonas sp.]